MREIGAKRTGLSKWTLKWSISIHTLPDEWHGLKDHILSSIHRKSHAIQQEQERLRQEQERQQTFNHRKELFDKNWDLVTKFLEITERKVSILDEYGEENWDALPEEIVTVSLKIAKRMKLPVGEKDVRAMLAGDGQWISDRLTAAFHEYHDKMKARPGRARRVLLPATQNDEVEADQLAPSHGGLALSRPIASMVLVVLMIGLILTLPQRAGTHPGENQGVA